MLVMKRVGLFVLVLLALSATQALAQSGVGTLPLQPGELYDHNAFLDAFFSSKFHGGPEVPSLPAPQPEPEAAPAAVSMTLYQQTAEALKSGTGADFEAATQMLRGLAGGGALPLGARGGAIMGSHREAKRSLKRMIRDLG